MMYVSECRGYRSILERRPVAGKRKPARYGDVFAIMRYAAAVLILVLVGAGFMTVGTGATGREPAAPSPSESVVIVSAGETLWEIAAAHKAEGMDTRRAVYEIRKRNGLEGSALRAGQRLIIPDWSDR